MAVVEAQDLWRRFGTFAAVRGVSFSIEAGEVVGLLGPNGAGKSTTMKVLTGYLAPTSGEVRVGGHDVLADPLRVREQLGYLPENAPIYRSMTVRAYLDFTGRVRGLGAAERTRAIERSAEETGLADHLAQDVGTLSRGYRQRVGLAAALLHRPPLLILDEPTSGLDPNQIVEIRQLIRRLGETHTVILSTHILPEVQVTCDRVLIIHQGELVADGPTDAIMSGSQGTSVTVGVAAGKVRVGEGALVSQLEALPHVTRARLVTPVGEAHRFTVEADDDVRAAVFQWAVDRGHVLTELSAHQSNLEEVFRRLTLAEDASGEDAA